MIRKTIHISVGFFVFLLPILTWWQAALCALTALLFNIFIMPQIGGERLLRKGQEGKWLLSGIVAYPAAVLLLILMFMNHLEIVMLAWGIMAFGDGFAGIFGKGGTSLPWNPNKTWLGFVTMFTVSEITCVLLTIYWTWFEGHGSFTHDFYRNIIIFIIPSLIAAITESLSSKLDDNWYLSLFVAPVLYLALNPLFEGFTPFIDNPIIGLFMGSFALYYGNLQFSWLAYLSALNLILAVLVWRLKLMSGRGTIIGFFLANGLLAYGGIFGFWLLFVFFALSAISGLIKKNKIGRAIEKRDESSVFSKGIVGLVLVYYIPVAHMSGTGVDFYNVFIAAIPIFATWAAAAFDTVSSDIGSAYGKRAYHIWGFKRVSPGSEGAISLIGTLTGIFASIIVSVFGILFYFIFLGWTNIEIMSISHIKIISLYIISIVLVSFIANIAESLLGQLLEEKGYITKTISNLFVTGFSAYLSYILFIIGCRMW